MRIRISFEKGPQLRFTSTLDLQSIWERSMRRAAIKVQYSKGFHPKPRIQIGIPLPLGCVGLDEKVDILLENTLSLAEISKKLQGKLPKGLVINSIDEIEVSEKPLSSQVQFSEYKVYLLNDGINTEEIQKQINRFLNAKEVIRTKRNGKKYDLKELILLIELKHEKNNPFIFLRVLSQSNKTGRADEVMFALGLEITDFLSERIGFYI